MRKLISVFVAATLLNGSILFLVACAKKYYFDSNIWVITDAGIVTDASFNESAWDGVSKYVISQKDKEILPSEWKKVTIELVIMNQQVKHHLTLKHLI